MSNPESSQPAGGKKHQPFVPESMAMTEFTLRAVHPRARHDARPRRRERLPGAAGRPDDRRHLSGGGHQHGGPARFGEDRSSRRTWRGRRARSASRWRRERSSRCRRSSIAGAWPSFRRRRLLEIDRSHDGRSDPRRALRLARPARDGRGPDAPVPRVRRGGRDPQGRAARRRGGEVPLLQHGLRGGSSISSAPRGSLR